MAGCTASGNASVVHYRGLRQLVDLWQVSQVAVVGMCVVALPLACSAVMAASATRSDASVVHRRTSFEAGGVLMASLASRCGWDMCAGLLSQS